MFIFYSSLSDSVPEYFYGSSSSVNTQTSKFSWSWTFLSNQKSYGPKMMGNPHCYFFSLCVLYPLVSSCRNSNNNTHQTVIKAPAFWTETWKGEAYGTIKHWGDDPGGAQENNHIKSPVSSWADPQATHVYIWSYSEEFETQNKRQHPRCRLDI